MNDRSSYERFTMVIFSLAVAPHPAVVGGRLDPGGVVGGGGVCLVPRLHQQDMVLWRLPPYSGKTISMDPGGEGD